LRQADGDGAPDGSSAAGDDGIAPGQVEQVSCLGSQQVLLRSGASRTLTIVAPVSSIVNNEGK
jgi:hypothetical protein